MSQEHKSPSAEFMWNYISLNINTIPITDRETIFKEWNKDATLNHKDHENGILIKSDNLTLLQVEFAFRLIMNIKDKL